MKNLKLAPCFELNDQQIKNLKEIVGQENIEKIQNYLLELERYNFL